jgi:hypothetical protein
MIQHYSISTLYNSPLHKHTHTHTHTLWLSVITSHILATDFNIGTITVTLQIPHVKFYLHRLTFKCQLNSQSSSTAVSRDSRNSISADLGSSLYSLGADPTENTVLILIAQQYHDCCLLIRCHGNLFTESLPSSDRLLWLHYSIFHASSHNMNMWSVLF